MLPNETLKLALNHGLVHFRKKIRLLWPRCSTSNKLLLLHCTTPADILKFVQFPQIVSLIEVVESLEHCLQQVCTFLHHICLSELFGGYKNLPLKLKWFSMRSDLSYLQDCKLVPIILLLLLSFAIGKSNSLISKLDRWSPVSGDVWSLLH